MSELSFSSKAYALLAHYDGTFIIEDRKSGLTTYRFTGVEGLAEREHLIHLWQASRAEFDEYVERNYEFY